MKAEWTNWEEGDQQAWEGTKEGTGMNVITIHYTRIKCHNEIYYYAQLIYVNKNLMKEAI